MDSDFHRRGRRVPTRSLQGQLRVQGGYCSSRKPWLTLKPVACSRSVQLGFEALFEYDVVPAQLRVLFQCYWTKLTACHIEMPVSSETAVRCLDP